MAVSTAKIVWTPGTPNKTPTRMLQIIRDFVVSNGWTLLTDKTADTSAYYFVVTYNRNTGFVGDNPIVQICYTATAPTRIYMNTYESWNTTTLVGTNPAYNPDMYSTIFSLYDNTTIYLSCSPEFILMSSDSNQSWDWYRPVYGVSCIERLPGDNDPGTFYGLVNPSVFDATSNIYIPKTWDGSTAGNSYFKARTRLGTAANVGLYDVDESGQHVMFNLTCSRPDRGKLKGKIYGIASTTYTDKLGHHLLLPSSTAPQWLLTKYVADSRYTMAMAVSPVITTLS